MAAYSEWLTNRWNQLCILLVILAICLMFVGLGREAFQDYDEGTYAEVVRETVDSGNLLTLRYQDTGWFEKPPLYFWAAMMADHISTDIEFSYRLPSAFLGVISIILVMLIAYTVTASYPVTLLSGLVLLLSPPFLEASRQMRLDVPVTAAILFAFYAFLLGLKRPVWLLGVGIGIGLGIMLKSVIGLFVLPLIGLWALLYRDFSFLKSWYFWGGVVLMFVILVPWHIYETVTIGQSFWDDYLLKHVVGRFETNILGNASTGSNATYYAYLKTFALPWTVVFLLLGTRLLYLKKRSVELRPALVFGGFALFIVLVFSVAGTKIPYYLTPIYPFIALFIGYVFWELYSALRISHKPLAVGAFTLVVSLGLINSFYVAFHYQPLIREAWLGAEAEKEVGLFLSENPSPEAFYTYGHPHWETIRYYSGGRRISAMKDDQILDEPFFLLLRTPVYDLHPFPPELESHFMLAYQSDSFVVLIFTP